MSSSIRVGLTAVICLSIFMLSSSSASAGAITSGNVSFRVEAENVETGEKAPTFQQDYGIAIDGSFAAAGLSESNGFYELGDFAIEGNIDPVANLAYGIRNTSAFAMSFDVFLTVPVAPQGPTTLIGGSTGGSVTDANVSGGVMATDDGGLPFYRGRIDGTTVLSLHAAPFVFSAPAGTGSIPPVSSGLPGPTLPGPPATTDIEIRNTFILSPGDSLSATNVFQVEPIPEPASVMLTMFSVFAIVTVTLRRRS